jgi:hypothetical protein
VVRRNADQTVPDAENVRQRVMRLSYKSPLVIKVQASFKSISPDLLDLFVNLPLPTVQQLAR